jgi:MoxR-like ATPase
MARRRDEVELRTVTGAEELLEMRRAVEGVHVEPDVVRYIVRLAQGTRRDEQLAVGASPRASLALLKLARAKAALEGRAFVIPDDVKFVAEPVLVHRLILRPDLWARDLKPESVAERIIHAVPVPKI